MYSKQEHKVNTVRTLSPKISALVAESAKASWTGELKLAHEALLTISKVHKMVIVPEEDRFTVRAHDPKRRGRTMGKHGHR